MTPARLFKAVRRSRLTLSLFAIGCAAMTACGTSSGAPHSDRATETGGRVPSNAAPLPTTSPVRCPTASMKVQDSDGLGKALGAAKPGDVIDMANGTYSGHFIAQSKGTKADPIFLCGGRGAIVDGGGMKSGIALHLTGAAYWRISGFSIRDAQKGVVTDTTTDTVIEDLDVGQIGDEAIHLREFSSGNSVQGNVVHDTGRHTKKFGEGIYIGSAKSNWCTYTKCAADRSDNNLVAGNTISHTTAENVDIKEGTTGGTVRDNHFDAVGMAKADSWVDVKGNGWTLENNAGSKTGSSSVVDGYQTHQILDGWGTGNTFRGNTGDLSASGYGFHLTPATGNTVSCDNHITGAASGLANVSCT